MCWKTNIIPKSYYFDKKDVNKKRLLKKMVRPRVLIVENSLDITGGLNSILRSSELLKDHFDFYFLLPSGSKAPAYVQQKGFVVVQLPMKEIRKNVLSILQYFPMLVINALRLQQLVKKTEISLIVSNDFYNMILPVYKIIGGLVPYVSYVRFLPSKFPKGLVHCWSGLHDRYAKKMIAVSEMVRTELPHQENVEVVNNEFPIQPVDLTTSSSRVILYPANYIQGKGQDLALQCFHSLHRHFPEWKFRFVGGDMGLDKNKQYKKKLMGQSINMGLEKFIEWGEFSYQMDQEYLNAEIVLNFSASESFSLTVLEAMFYGRTIVATRSGGPQEIIEHGVNGALVNVGDVQLMINILEELMSKTEKRNALAAAGYFHVRKKYDLAQIRDQLLAIYTASLAT